MSALSRSHAPTFSYLLSAALLLTGINLIPVMTAQAQTEKTIFNFGPTAPITPLSGMVFDSSGNLYGVTPYGGASNRGVVYKLSRVSGGWQESVIYNFTGGADGGNPFATPIPDAAGNLYGTAQIGGALGFGVVYKLSPNASGGWRESVLYAFAGGNDGMSPSLGNLVMDQAGNLYGSNVAGANVTSDACSNTGG
jgi:uncharacterized repeat protein (TIGR03803 family)